MATMIEAAAKNNVDWDKLDVGIEHVGRVITLPGEPEKMPTRKAIEALQRREADDNQEFQVREAIDAYPLDAAVACTRAMTNLYGWASPRTTIRMTMLGPKEQPPHMLSVKVGLADDDVVMCPLGEFKLPGLDSKVATVISGGDFIIHAKVPKKHRHVVLELANETRRIVREQSIYKGKVIRLGVDDDGDLDTDNPPAFLDVSDTTEAAVLFDEEIRDQIDTNMLVPIKETERCRALKIPLKRTGLFEGPFGTGKSLTARMVANVAERHGWTFVLLDKVQGLRAALEFAKRYAPAVVFAEDIDRITQERDDEMNDLINIIDGVVSKRSEIMTILTTNFVDKINPVVLRPGRLDAVISIRPPGPKTVERLIRHYAGDLIPAAADLKGAGRELGGQIPATIRECVERAKLSMVGRKAEQLADRDLVIAAMTMKNHLALLNRDDAAPSAADRLATSLHEVLGNGDLAHIKQQIGTVLERLS